MISIYEQTCHQKASPEISLEIFTEVIMWYDYMNWINHAQFQGGEAQNRWKEFFLFGSREDLEKCFLSKLQPTHNFLFNLSWNWSISFPFASIRLKQIENNYHF